MTTVDKSVDFDLNAVCDMLMEKTDVRFIVGTYSGCGDSGEFEDVAFFKVLDSNNPRKNKEATVIPEECEEFDTLLSDLVDDYHDYCNDDGGSGTITLDVEKRTILIEHEDYYQTSDSYETLLEIGKDSNIKELSNRKV